MTIFERHKFEKMGDVNNTKLSMLVFFIVLTLTSSALEDGVCNECQFPFEYDGITFDGCTFYQWYISPDYYETDYTQPKTWCVTNKTAFLEDDANGWEYCSSECTRDSERVCNQCQVPFEWDGITFHGCTFYRWQSDAVDKPTDWCVTNKTAFLGDENEGWEYCPPKCS